MHSRNPAARVGRWSAQHRRTAIIGWIAFVVLATVLGGKVGQNDVDEFARGNGESKRGDMIVEAAGFPDQAGEQVLVQGKGPSAPTLPATAAVRDVVRRLERIDGITEIETRSIPPPVPRPSRRRAAPSSSTTMAGTSRSRSSSAGRCRGGRRPGRPPRCARRAVRRRVGRQGDRRPGQEGREGRGTTACC